MRNKCQQMNTYTTTGKKHRIVALTETWSKDHFTEEYKKFFPSFHISRSDRDTDAGLKSKGGCMVLTSPELPSRKIEKYSFSNGYCELLTVEAPTINTNIIIHLVD